MNWSMPLKDHFKITHGNIAVTNYLVKNEELLIFVWTGSYHHLTIRSKNIIKNPFVLNRYKVPNLCWRKYSTNQYFLVDGRLLISHWRTYWMNKFAWIRALRDIGITGKRILPQQLIIHTFSLDASWGQIEKGFVYVYTFARNFNE